MFPTGNLTDTLEVPNIGSFEVTMINAGIPTVFLKAEDLGYNGTELQDHINYDAAALVKFETIRAYAAQQMGLIQDISEAVTRQHTPKIALWLRQRLIRPLVVRKSLKQIAIFWSVPYRWVSCIMP